MIRKQVNVGIVGAGSLWETKFRPALSQLQDRIRIVAVSDHISARAEHVANELKVKPVHGVLQMARQENLNALLILESGWRGNELLRLLFKSEKPMLVAEHLGTNLEEINSFRQLVETSGLICVPAFEHRYTPASGRFQELLATQLGQPHNILIDALIPPDDRNKRNEENQSDIELLANVFDWCHRIIRTAPQIMKAQLRTPAQFSGERLSDSSADWEIDLNYPVAQDESQTISVEIRLRKYSCHLASNTTDELPETTSILYEAHCEHGKVVMNSATEISWSAHGQVYQENLAADCSSIEVMLDHFCRRVVGGLIPVADLADVSRSVELALQVKNLL